jgi:hypothetical protein
LLAMSQWEQENARWVKQKGEGWDGDVDCILAILCNNIILPYRFPSGRTLLDYSI